MTDQIQVEILDDGTVSITTDAVSGQNHKSADELLAYLAELTGGPVKVKKRKGQVHRHVHEKGAVKH